MTVEAWPAILPCLARDGYGYELPELNSSTDFLLGARRRPLFADGPDRFSASATFSADQCAYFQGWLRYAISNGASWFSITLTAAGVSESHEVRLTAPPTFTLVAIHHYRVTLPLETRTGTTMTRAEWDALNP